MEEISVSELEDLIQDLGGRPELTIDQVQIFYAADEELERRHCEQEQ